MFTNSAAAELGRRTIVTGITKNWVTPVVKAAARSRSAVIRLMLCRQYDASAHSKTAAANQECAATVRSALRAHRSQLERKCAHNCCRSSGVIRHANGGRSLGSGPPRPGHPLAAPPCIRGRMHGGCHQGARSGWSCTGAYTSNTGGAHIFGTSTCGSSCGAGKPGARCPLAGGCVHVWRNTQLPEQPEKSQSGGQRWQWSRAPQLHWRHCEPGADAHS